jgi:hypothetical protein
MLEPPTTKEEPMILDRRFKMASWTSAALLLLVAPTGTSAQGAVDAFHSTQSANLPTAATIPGGLWMFEISHRFLPAVSDGREALWGLDGPVYNRLGLAYGATDHVMIGLLRSNFDDNLEFNAKALALEGQIADFTYKVAGMAGIAINFGATEFGGVEDNEAQYYVQAMLNASFRDLFALGVVPTVFRNPRIEDIDPVNTFALGLHGQYYATRSISVLAEWIVSVESVNYPHDGVSFGFEIETRGHYFKLLLTNQVRMNPTQFLVGTPFEYGKDDWRLGFNVTRLLSF